MSKFKVAYKRQMSDLLAAGHRKFGKVLPRRPYREEDESGEGGGAGLVFESHPLLDQQPLGASSDLTAIIGDNRDSLDEAEKRSNEAVPELKKQLEMKLGKQLQKTQTLASKPSPFTT
jgi:hypothetical protein